MDLLDLPDNLANSFKLAGDLLTAAFDRDISDVARLGGGSTLATYYQHRLSTDLDFFSKLPSAEMTALIIDSKKMLSSNPAVSDLIISPRTMSFNLNGTAMSLFTSSNILNTPIHSHSRVHKVELESTEEILAKKLILRVLGNGTFTERDFYDFCVVWKVDREPFNQCKELIPADDWEKIAQELSSWRSSPIVGAGRQKPLLNPKYPNLGNDLWEYAARLFSVGDIPEQAFATREVER